MTLRATMKAPNTTMLTTTMPAITAMIDLALLRLISSSKPLALRAYR
jgi:hypothetical protein